MITAREACAVALIGLGFAAGNLTSVVAGPGLRPHVNPLGQPQWQELGRRLSQDEGLSTEAEGPDRDGMTEPTREFPAAAALVQIGRPAARAAVSWLMLSDDPLARKLCAHAILQIEGHKAGRLLLEQINERSANEREYARAKEALAVLAGPGN